MKRTIITKKDLRCRNIGVISLFRGPSSLDSIDIEIESYIDYRYKDNNYSLQFYGLEFVRSVCRGIEISEYKNTHIRVELLVSALNFDFLIEDNRSLRVEEFFENVDSLYICVGDLIEYLMRIVNFARSRIGPCPPGVEKGIIALLDSLSARIEQAAAKLERLCAELR